MEKNLKEDSKFNELWNFSLKQNKKKKIRKILKFKELYFPDTLLDKFPANYTKIYNTLSFLSLSFSFLLYKILFQKLYCLRYLFELVSELETCGTYCLNLHTEAS